MKVVSKKDLSYEAGYVVSSSGDVVNNPQIVTLFNELMEVKDFNKFIKDNKAKIEAVGTTVTYTPPKPETAIQVKVPKTPLADKAKEEALEMWNELSSVESTNEVNDILERYDMLANFIVDETILITGDITSTKFNGNPLELDKKGLIAIVKTYVELRELRNKVVVTP